MTKLYKFEMTPDVVKYLLQAIQSQQIRGEQQASSLLTVLQVLRNPVNKKELAQAQLDELNSEKQGTKQ